MWAQIVDFLFKSVSYILGIFYLDGIYLLISIVLAVCFVVYIDPVKIRKFFLSHSNVSIFGSVAVGAFTPLCACGTMAVILSLISTSLPWGPIMAFLVSSPLMSPDVFVLLAGFLSLPFAVTLTIVSIVLGLGAGYITHFIEKNTKFLVGQLRLDKANAAASASCCGADAAAEELCCGSGSKNVVSESCCSSAPPKVASGSCCGGDEDVESTSCCSNDIDISDVLSFGNSASVPCSCSEPEKNESTCGCGDGNPVVQKEPKTFIEKLKLKEFALQFYKIGIKTVLPIFAIFVFLAYLVKTYIPTSWIVALFSGHQFYSVPLAALIGVPIYVADAAVIPLLQVLKEAGASQGSILAFMVTGPGTSIGVIAGLNLIMKKRPIMLYCAFLIVGAILSGYIYDFILYFAKH